MTGTDRSFSTPRRIALVSEHYLPHIGGIEQHVATLAGRLKRAGHEVHVITSFPGPEETADIRVHRVPVPLLPVVKVPFTPRGIIPLERLLRDQAFDLVHCHYSVVSPGVACAAYHAQRLGIPTLVTFHSVLNGYSPAFRVLDRWVGWSRWRLAYSAVSELVAEGVRRLVRESPVTILPNGVDRQFWLGDAIPSGISSGGLEGGHSSKSVRVISTMRLAPRKRPRALVEVVARLQAVLPSDLSFELVIVGDGPERGALLRQIETLGLGGVVRIESEIERAELPGLYADSDLFVLPSLEESFGLAALEARCAGLPVVAMAESGLGRIIEPGVEGMLAESDADLIGCLAHLMTDPGVRETMRAHNRSTAPPFAWENVVERHLREYESVSRGTASQRH
jgi:glycosyltransferase involved in cell wall biosynthesis